MSFLFWRSRELRLLAPDLKGKQRAVDKEPECRCGHKRSLGNAGTSGSIQSEPGRHQISLAEIHLGAVEWSLWRLSLHTDTTECVTESPLSLPPPSVLPLTPALSFPWRLPSPCLQAPCQTLLFIFCSESNESHMRLTKHNPLPLFSLSLSLSFFFSTPPSSHSEPIPFFSSSLLPSPPSFPFSQPSCSF